MRRPHITHRIYLAVFFVLSVFLTIVPKIVSSADFLAQPSSPPAPPFVVTSADKILYVAGTANAMFTINPDGTGKTFLGGGVWPTWSPDGTKIAYFFENTLTHIKHLWVMNADGTGKTQLNFNGNHSGQFGVSWSPDGQRLTFQVMEGAGLPDMEIYVVNVNGTGLTRLTNDTFEDNAPKWSPDGTKIAFSSRRGGTNEDVYTINPDGSNLQRLTDFGLPGNNAASGQSWSPDGTKIAFVRTLVKNIQGVNTNFNQLMVMSASGGGQGVLHEMKNSSFSFPTWSNDGSRIGIHRRGTIQEPANEVMTVSASGGAGFVAYSDTLAPQAWSPDDSRFVYTNGGNLYVSSDEDSGTRIKLDTANDMPWWGPPTWKPRPPCNCPTISQPALQFVQSHWPDPRTNWAMLAEVTAQDGLVLKDVMLGERYLAKKISVPYYNLETTAYSNRGELKPNSIEADGTRRTRLVEYKVFEHSEKLVVEAVYAIDKIPATSTSCLFITQRYEFLREGVGGRCEPSGTLKCSRFKPLVSYRFFGQPGESMVALNIPQLRHFQVDQNAKNSAGLFKDCDTHPCVPLPGNSVPGIFGFERKENPLFDEYYGEVITNGRTLGVWDNIHTTQFDTISEPGLCIDCPDTFPVGAGCPECMHSHWRWAAGASNMEQFGHGNLMDWPPGSNQDFSFAVVKHRSTEEHPTDFKTLANSERIRTTTTTYGPNIQRYEFSHPLEIAVWYSSTGHKSHDIFYGFGLFFSGAQRSVQVNGPMGPPELGLDRSTLYSNSELVDELTAVVVENLYAEGETTLTPFNPNVVGPLPAGYVAYNNLVINVETEAETSGPNLVTFTVPSVTDPEVFNNLRIFHAEVDPFAPNQPIWVDRTVLAPDPLAPDFINKTITARTRVLGGFAVAALGTPQSPPGNAGIAVTAGHTPSQIVAGNEATYTFTVSNSGPDDANGVRLEAQLPPNSIILSATPSQGICSYNEGPVRCKLDTLPNNASANVTVVARMTQGGLTLPPTGKTINAIAIVRANETDSDLNDNELIHSAVLLPDTNAAPVVKLLPLATSLFTSPANITLVANATDSDGTITEVEFFDKSISIGLATATGGNDYSRTWNPAPIGTHSIVAIATDNAGRKSITDILTFRVNGPATVTITSPASGLEFPTTATIPLTANATYAGGSISQVAFYANGTFLGNGTPGSPNQYNFNWTGLASGMYSVVAIATDNNELETASKPVLVNVRLNSAPTTSILSPANGSAFPTPGNVVITASAVDTDGAITSVKFFDGAVQIGTGTSIGSDQYRMTWSNPSAGAHSITAVVVDDSNASVTTSPINITVSAPPSASISSPTGGTQFTAPAAVALVASASDSDGTIARTDFYANGTFIGTGTSSGPNQYSFNWTNVGFGSYNLTAVAVDNSGLATTSAAVSISVTTPVLFVANSTTLNTAENVIKGRLEALNHTVVVKTASAAVTADADGKALVVISSTVTPSQVGTKYRTVAVPVLTWESGIYNNMGMTGSGNSDFGTKNNQTQVSITNPNHVLAAGFSGNTTVASAGTFNWGKPNANAVSIATVVNDTAKTLIFGYPSGVAMPGLTAPARRVGMFMHDNTTLNSSGIAMLDAAIIWAIGGGGSLSGSFVNSSPASVNLTSEGLIDWAHWGRGGGSVFDHRTGVNQISNFTKLGTGGLSWFSDGPTAFSWTNGTPVLSILNTPTGSNTNGAVGNGFEITVPADTVQKTLKLYVGVWFTQAKLEATLSDDSAAAYVDSSLTHNTGSAKFGVYTIQYKAGAPGQTLKLRYTILNQFFSPNGNVALEAVTLQ